MQICTTVTRLVTVLQRTGTAPLNVTLAYIHYDLLTNQLYSRLFSQKIRPRIARLTLDYSGSWNSYSPLSVFMTKNPLELRNLVSFHVFEHSIFAQPRDDKSIFQVILEGSYKLKELCVGVNFLSTVDPSTWQGTLNSAVFPDCIVQAAWRHTSYSLTIRNLDHLQVALGEVVHIIYGKHVPVLDFVTQSVSQIERADSTEMWNINTVPWPTSASPITTFTRIKYLHLILDDISLLTKLDLPVLEELSLTQSSRSRNQAIHRWYTEPLASPNVAIYFPKLHTLKATHSHFSPLRWISAKQLDSIHLISTLLSREEAEMDFTVLFSSIKSPKSQDTSLYRIPSTLLDISRLHINTNIPERILTRALESLPRLEFLSLVPGNQLQRVFTKELTVDVQYDTVKTNILCPVLQVLELDLHSFLEWDEMGKKAMRVGTTTLEDFPLALKRMVSSRELGYTYPLERCTVIEKDGTRREYVSSIGDYQL